MLRLFIIVGFLLFSRAGLAQEQLLTDSTVTVVGNWKKGDKARFLIVKTKTQSQGRLSRVTDSLGAYAEISVLEADSGRFIMQWKSIPPKNAPAAQDAASRFLDNLEFKYTVLQTGEYAGLLNADEIKDAAYRMIDKTVKERNIKDPKFSAEMKKMFSSKENIEAAVMRDVLVYHTLYGGEYTLKKKISEPSLLPNVLGGDPLPAILTAELTGINRLKNTCTIKINHVLDPAKINAAMADWRKKYVKSRNTKTPSISVNDNITVTLDLVNGWFNEINNVRNVVVNGVKVVERVTVKKIN